MSTRKKTSTQTNLCIFLGNTADEQLQSLQEIKNAMVDVMITNRAEDGNFYDSTMDIIEQVYFQARTMVDQMISSKYVN